MRSNPLLHLFIKGVTTAKEMSQTQVDIVFPVPFCPYLIESISLPHNKLTKSTKLTGEV